MIGSTPAGSAGAAGSLPTTLPRAVRAELRRAMRPPYQVPGVVAGNGLLMTACWTLLPPAAVNYLFHFHGPLAFAIVLAIWMYSDVPATNLLGGDPARSVAALDDPATLRRLWYAKNILLWLLVTPVCSLVAVGIGVHEHRMVTAALTVGWIATVPLGALGFANWVGVWFPFHVLPLRYRWARRRHWWRMLARWMMLLVAPANVVPTLMLALTVPSLLLWNHLTPWARERRISDAAFGLGLLLTAAISAVAWPVGHWYGSHLASRRRQWLTGFLTDPDRG